jgi:hypothetical protein
MVTAGLALGWESWSRLRVLLAIALAYLLGLEVLVWLYPSGTFDARATVPLWVIWLTMAAVGSEGHDLLGRESCYPRRNFLLPVPTALLVLWPMATRALAVALCWLVACGFVLRSAGLTVPLFWPTALVVAVAVWVQALLWYPFPLPYLRGLVANPLLGGMIVAGVLGYQWNVDPALPLAVAGALIPTGFLVAVRGVARARRGDTPVWHWPALRLGGSLASAQAPFRSATDALFWVDWGRNGYLLPAYVGLSVFPILILLAICPPAAPGVEAAPAGAFLCSIVCFTPAMAAGAGISLGNTRYWASDLYEIPPFLAARPVTSADLIRVKLRVAFRTTLLACGLAMLGIVIAITLSPIAATLAGWVRAALDAHGSRAGVLLALSVPVLVVLNCKAIVDHLWLGLAGRMWLILTLLPVMMAALFVVGALAWWIWTTSAFAAIPWLVSLALAMKLAAGAVVGSLLWYRGLVALATLTRIGAAWFACALLLFGLAYCVVPAELYSPLVVGTAAVVLLLPMVRLGLAPLALDWNRHR